MRTLLVMMMLVGCSGDEEDGVPRATPCENLREHLIDLRLATATNVDHKAHREVMQASLGSDFLASCAKLDEAVVTCALAAPDSQRAAACNASN
ncbi:MAG: hypothetical protein ACKV2T_34620 [Kofleriaceae bacterium]